MSKLIIVAIAAVYVYKFVVFLSFVPQLWSHDACWETAACSAWGLGQSISGHCHKQHWCHCPDVCLHCGQSITVPDSNENVPRESMVFDSEVQRKWKVEICVTQTLWVLGWNFLALNLLQLPIDLSCTYWCFFCYLDVVGWVPALLGRNVAQIFARASSI